MELTERLNKIFKHYGMRKYSEFAEKTGLSHQVSSNYLKGKQKPDAEKLSIIIQSFDDINAEWLLTGKGEMLKKDDINFTEKEEKVINSIINDFENINMDDLVRYLSHNDKKLMENPIYSNYIGKKIYKAALEIAMKNK